MSKLSITLKRDGIKGFLSEDIGSEAATAMYSIPGVADVDIVHVSESGELVELTYTWSGERTFWSAGEHLNKHWLTFANSSPLKPSDQVFSFNSKAKDKT